MDRVNLRDFQVVTEGAAAGTGKPFSEPLTSDRLVRLCAIIDRSRRARGLRALSDDGIALEARAYHDALAGVPTDELENCYEAAIAEYRDGDPAPFSALHIKGAWRRRQEAAKPAPQYWQDTKDLARCEICSGTGWYYPDGLAKGVDRCRKCSEEDGSREE